MSANTDLLLLTFSLVILISMRDKVYIKLGYTRKLAKTWPILIRLINYITRMCKQILSPMNEYYYMILSFIKLSCRDLKFIYNI